MEKMENHKTEETTPTGEKEGRRSGRKLIRITSKAGEMTFGKLLTSPMTLTFGPIAFRTFSCRERQESCDQCQREGNAIWLLIQRRKFTSAKLRRVGLCVSARGALHK
ncbi:hypothetical protein BaRGS_00002805 [Batillaria attramentaria]|uniref:Uncharacterized protein n=1 Tax=Batillaria attramentaria TaxID=370345 RepID=A0ABD0M3Y1_9CAEN